MSPRPWHEHGTSGSGGGYLRVPTGFLGLGREHHIPFSAIRSVEGDHINLGMSKDELDDLGYGETPTAIDDDRRRLRARHATPRVRRDHHQPAGNREVVAENDDASSWREPAAADERRRLQLREEELIPRKRTVQTGEVRLQTDVVEEQRTVEVPVTHEEVYVERHAVDRRPADRPISEQNETITVPVSEEEVTVEKRAVVYEEVEVGKRAMQETESVDATVRREELRVEDKDNVLAGAGGGTAASSQGNVSTTPGTSTTSGWTAAMPGYRTRWQKQYGSSGGRWEDVEPSYEYGYGLRDQAQYRGKRWSEIEPDVQRDWTRTNPNTPWDRASQGIRDAWENVTNLTSDRKPGDGVATPSPARPRWLRPGWESALVSMPTLPGEMDNHGAGDLLPAHGASRVYAAPVPLVSAQPGWVDRPARGSRPPAGDRATRRDRVPARTSLVGVDPPRGVCAMQRVQTTLLGGDPLVAVVAP